ncbi:hypothetical protein J3F83DRAFT_737537 [Trichoderma novae-zelandiae]
MPRTSSWAASHGCCSGPSAVICSPASSALLCPCKSNAIWTPRITHPSTAIKATCNPCCIVPGLGRPSLACCGPNLSPLVPNSRGCSAALPSPPQEIRHQQETPGHRKSISSTSLVRPVSRFAQNNKPLTIVQLPRQVPCASYIQDEIPCSRVLPPLGSAARASSPCSTYLLDSMSDRNRIHLNSSNMAKLTRPLPLHAGCQHLTAAMPK